MLIIQGYDLTIEYREHDANANADGLSRTPLPKEAIQLLTPIIREDLNEWKAAQAADPFCIQVLQSINEDKYDKQSVQFLQLPNGILTMPNGAIIVPSTLRNKILLKYHNHREAGGHQGIAKTTARIKARFGWPHMSTDIRVHIKNCLVCAERKAQGGCKAPLRPLPVSDYFGALWSLDCVGPLPISRRGNVFILAMIENQTRWLEAVAIKEQTAATIARKFISRIVLRHGQPSAILTDGATTFQADVMTELLEILKIKRKKSAAYAPWANGQVESVNKGIISMLNSYASSKDGFWCDNLKYAQHAYNCSIHSSTKETPYFLVHCRDNIELPELGTPSRYRYENNEAEKFKREWTDAIELAKANLVIAKHKQKKTYDTNAKLCTYAVGDRVLLRIMTVQTGKFYKKWEGVYIVTKQISSTTYVVQLEGTNADYITHVNRIKLWKKAEECEEPRPASPTLPLKIITPPIPSPPSPATVTSSNMNKQQTPTTTPTKRGRGRPKRDETKPKQTTQKRATSMPSTSNRHSYNLRTKY